jgi:hypothetical protein
MVVELMKLSALADVQKRYETEEPWLTESWLKLRRAIWVLNQTFNELKLEKHPEKTSMGRIEQGFDFLSYSHPMSVTSL